MHLLAFVSLLTVALALPQQGYRTPTISTAFKHGSTSTSLRDHGSSGLLHGGSAGTGLEIGTRASGLGQVSVVLDESVEDLTDSDEIQIGLIGTRGSGFGETGGVPLSAVSSFGAVSGSSGAGSTFGDVSGISSAGSTFGDVSGISSVGSSFSGIECAEGELLGHDGSCTEAEVTRTIFVYDAPQVPFRQRTAAIVARKPKLNYNIVFVHTPEGDADSKPIVIPPPQHKTLVYVLNKLGLGGEQEVIELPVGPSQKPEVFYINYEEGENPQLPIGIDLQTALASVNSQQPKVLGGLGLGSGISVNLRTGGGGTGIGLPEAGIGAGSDIGVAADIGVGGGVGDDSLFVAGQTHESGVAPVEDSGTLGISLASAVHSLGSSSGAQQVGSFVPRQDKPSSVYGPPHK